MDEIQPEEYNVYSDVLRQRLDRSSSNFFVIEDHTTTCLHRIPQDVVELFEKGFGIQDIRERNQESHRLENRFALGANIVLIPKEEVSRFFSPAGGGWETFHAKYSNAGIVELSRVSFDADQHQAHLYFGVQADYLVGYGCHFLLESKLGQWMIKSELPAWKS